MADDRLDDAIAAVTRAVDRIEAVTRGVLDVPQGQAAEAPLPPQPRTPPPPAFTPQSTGFAARPTTALGAQEPTEPQVDPTWSDYEPPSEPEPEPQYAPAPFEPESAYEPAPFQPEPMYTPAPVEPDPVSEPDADPALAEVHELVGRVVARTQALEDHLEAARRLRAEITELVSRLAAAAERDR